MNYLVWSESDARANDILRGLIQQAKYGWVYRKLNNARFHIIETHTVSVDESRWNVERIVFNQDVSA